MSDGCLVQLEKRADGVAVITLNDPKRLNALTADMGDEFSAIVDSLTKDACQGVGAVVLTGSGRAFSAGGDLDFLRDRSNDTPSRNAVIMRRFYERFLSVRRLPVPVIAALNGPAIGAGLCLAVACDVRVAFSKAKLGVTFVNLGLHPGMGCTHFLPKVVGQQQASRLMLTGDVVSGTEAKEIGLALKVYDSPEECLQGAISLAGRMAKAAPIAVRSCARSLRMAQDDGLEKALWREADAQSQCYNTDDLKDGIEAVAEKRAPRFTLFEGHNE